MTPQELTHALKRAKDNMFHLRWLHLSAMESGLYKRAKLLEARLRTAEEVVESLGGTLTV